jgi:hypothetical protein
VDERVNTRTLEVGTGGADTNTLTTNIVQEFALKKLDLKQKERGGKILPFIYAGVVSCA